MPKGTDSTTKFKADITDFKAAMQEAARYVRLANSEFKEASAGLGKWSDSADGLSAKLRQLDKVLDAQKRQLDVLETEYEKVSKEQGETSKGAQELAIRINNQKAAIKTTESQLSKYSDQLEEVEKDSEDMGDAVEQSGNQAKGASDGFTVMKGALASLVADGIRLAVDGLKDLAKETYNVGTNFESSMSQVEAVSGATGEEIDALTKKAKEMGEKTKFSASESADAFNYMAMAGWKTEDMIGGIEGIMNLAAASGEDLATTSDIVTDALTAMGYSAKDSGKLADVMAAASSNANTNVAMMGQTFQYAAPIVGALGYSMEDTAVAIGLMANAGIKGEKAGTSLRTTLTRLSAPPKECAEAMEDLGLSITDSNGKMKPFNKIIKEMRKSFKGLSETQQTQYAKAIAGQGAMSGLLAIVNAAPSDFEKLTKAVEESNGAAEDMANTMNDNVSGQITLLKSKIEGIMIRIFEKLAPQIRKGIDDFSNSLDGIDWDKFAEGVGDFGQALMDAFKFILDNGGTILDLLKAIALAFVTYKAVSIIGGVITSFTQLFSLIKTGTGIMAALNTTMAISPVGLIATGVSALVAALVLFNDSSEDATKNLSEEAKATNDLIEENEELQESLENTAKARENAVTAVQEEATEADILWKKIKELNKVQDKSNAQKETMKSLVDKLNEVYPDLNLEYDKEKDKLNKTNKQIEKNIKLKKEQALAEAMQENAKDVIADIAKLTVKQEKLNQQQVKNKEEVDKTEAAYKKAHKALTDYVDKQYQGIMPDLRYTNDQTFKDLYHNSLELSQANLQAQKSYDDLQKSIDGNEKELKDLNGQYDRYQNAADKIINSQDIQKQLDDLAKKAKEQGVKIPKAISEGIKAGQFAVPGSVKQLKSLVKFNDLLTEAKSAGIEIPKSISDGIASGKLSPSKAVEQMNRLIKFDEAVKDAGLSGEKIPKKIKEGILSGKTSVDDAIKALKKSAKSELDKKNGEKEAGAKAGKEYVDGVNSKKSDAKTAGKNLAKEAKKGADTKDDTTNSETSGKNFSQGYIKGMGSLITTVWEKGKELAKNALSGLKKGQKEGSPSKITTQSGIYFGEGYNNGIKAMMKTVIKTAGKMGEDAVKSLQDAQEEGSPSKLTFKSGVNFVKGYINGISSMEKSLAKTVKNLVKGVTKELLKLENFNFSEVQENASNLFSDSIASKIDYMTNKIAYQNEKKIAEFDKTITNLEKTQTKKVTALEKERDKKISELETKRNKTTNKKQKEQIAKEINATKSNYAKRINAIKSQYSKLIKTQEKYKEAYEKESSEMLSEFGNALNEYQSKAQALIDDTINGITDTYQSRYDDLISKQDNLISKLQSAGELFEISNAGVITVGDLKEQTAQIKDYAEKLKKIKSKVSGDLFDQITRYDVKEGQAFINQLLAMSDAELKAYDEAYSEKMNLAESFSKDIYKQDFDKVESDYEKAIKKAFKNLPKQLEQLGNQAMKGFVDGLTKNTDYMDKNVKTFVKSMVSQFKKELKIKSPSRVMIGLGEYTGEGFGDGILNMIGYVKKAASSIANATASSLDSVKTNIGDMKSAVGTTANGLPASSSTVVNNYNLVQNNNSPKSLTALETYQARRQQLAMVKAATQSS